MRRFDLWLEPKPEAQHQSINVARPLRVYESSTGPFLSVIAVDLEYGRVPEGMRLDREQVVQLRDHLNDYLEGTA